MAKTLYIIHGWTYVAKSWDKTIEAVEKAGIKVKMLNVPGLTESSDKAWTIEDYVAWLKSELADKEAPIVLGHSNGGRIALNYAVKYPNKISHLILLDSAGIYDDRASLSMKRQVFKILAKILKPLKYVPLTKKIVYRALGASDYNMAPPNMKQTLVNMINSDRQLDLSRVSTPATLLWGLEDKTTPIAQGRKMHKLIAGSKLLEFANWRHSAYMTHPLELAQAIIKVVEKL